MNFSAWAIRRPLPSLMLFFILCVAGLWCFQHLSIARFPDVSLPMTTVTVTQPGASPSQLETEVTRKVEDAVATIPGIKRVMSSVDEGMSTTILEFHMDTVLSEALDDTRDAISRIRMDLPQDIQEPVVSKVDIGGALQTWAVVADHLQPDELSWFVDRDVTRAMYGIPGVAQVKRVGGIERQVRVDLDPAALQAYGITAGMVSQQLARYQVEQAGGRVELDGGRQVIRTVGTLATAQELGGYSIALPDGRSVRLSHLATIPNSWRCWTASRQWPSRSRARARPASWRWPTRSKRRLQSSRPTTPASTSAWSPTWSRRRVPPTRPR
jgi:multidrug efflux pump subunit AcrB